MRAYFFGNMYLSSIQQGVQSAHVLAQLFIKYKVGTKANMLYDWAANYETIILLNGGYSDTIRTLCLFFKNNENPYPWADFHEGADALDGALTSTGIILPEKIYLTAAFIRSLPHLKKINILDNLSSTGIMPIYEDLHNEEEWEISKWEFFLIQKLNEFSLAK